jgi:predicted esterase
MVPFEPETLPDLTGVPVFLSAGRTDPIVPVENTERLAATLREAGAEVTLHWVEGGHSLTREEVVAAQRWLAERRFS